MRIAIILNNLRGGGAERIAGYLSAFLSKDNCVYLFLQDSSDIVYEYGGKIIDLGKDGYEYYEYNVGLAKEKYDIDVSISFMEYFNHVNIRTRRNDAVIISERCYQSLMIPRRYGEEFQNKRLYPLADGIVSISEGVREELLKSYCIEKEKTETIYNFFDIEYVRRLANKRDISNNYTIKQSGEKWIVSIGRLVEQKGFTRLVREFAEVYRKHINCRLIIIGSGTDEPIIRKAIEEYNLVDSVTIINYSPNPFTVLKSADILVMSSRYEGYGNVLLEAMALDVPVVAVDCFAGPREIIDDNHNYDEQIDTWRVGKRGILVSRQDKGFNIAESIEKILFDDILRKALIFEAKKWIESRSNDDIYYQWCRFIDKSIEYKNNRTNTGYEGLVQGENYIIYGCGEFAEKVFIELKMQKIKIDAFVVTKRQGLDTFYGLPVYEREYLLQQEGKKNKLILGVGKLEYLNEICKWLLDNGIEAISYSLQMPNEH